MYWCGISWWSCISAGYRGDHLFLCVISWWSCISVGYLGGHVLVWYVEEVMY